MSKLTNFVVSLSFEEYGYEIIKAKNLKSAKKKAEQIAYDYGMRENSVRVASVFELKPAEEYEKYFTDKNREKVVGMGVKK
jgi:hypothetical protein